MIHVKQHYRLVNGKLVLVQQHDREGEAATHDDFEGAFGGVNFDEPEIKPEAPAPPEEPKKAGPVTITKEGDKFIAKFKWDPSVKDAVKAAGFKFDGYNKVWWTTDVDVAAKFQDAEGINELIKKHNDDLAAKHKAEQESIAESKAADSDAVIPVPEGLNYLPYQKAGIAFASKRQNALIADDMGLGKTIQAIGVANADPNAKKILIICPASLKLNWKREWEKWDVKGLKVGIAEGSTFPDADVVIMNYDIAAKLADQVHSKEWDLIIGDEAHYLKNPLAKRTQAILGGKGKKGAPDIKPFKAKRRVFLTGTPIVNRPKELWPLVQALDPDGLGKNWFNYAKRYCDLKKGWGGHWDDSGASNLEELQTKLRSSIMVRRLKKDVLTELPPKSRTIIPITPDSAGSKAIAEESAIAAQNKAMIEQLQAEVELAKASDNEEDYKEAVAKLKAGVKVAFQEMAKARKQVAMAKVPYVVDRVKDLVEETGKVIVMAHHHDVIDKIKAEFGEDAVVVDGRVDPGAERQKAVDAFQKDPSKKVFIGSIAAAGVGLTLTAAHTVVFAELDWVPGNMTQAEDRAHRIGQKDNVDVYHIVLDGSLDSRLAKVLVQKQEVIDQALDKGNIEAEAPKMLEPVKAKEEESVEDSAAAITKNESASKGTTSDDLKKQGEKLTPAQVKAIHSALQDLAFNDPDKAKSKNDVGFNGLDSMIGHSLAGQAYLTPKQAALGMKILKKYHGQVNVAHYVTIFGTHPSLEKKGKKEAAQ